MTDDQSSRPPAMVVATSDAEREECCRELIRHGYAVVGFADCVSAAAWLEEETPAVAILVPELKGQCDRVLAALAERDVPLAASGRAGQRS